MIRAHPTMHSDAGQADGAGNGLLRPEASFSAQ